MLTAENKSSLKLIQDLCVANGVSGFEDEVVAIAKEYSKDFSVVEENSLRSLVIKPNYNKGNRPIVMLDGHSDELGFIVQNILPNGQIKFLPLGGWIPTSLPSSKVRILNKDGKYITGVIASKPPHFMSEAERKKEVTIDSLTIDVGACSYDEVVNDFGIELAAPIVPDVGFEFNENNNVMMTKAIDNRIGCALVLETLKQIDSSSIKVDVVGSLSSQEEVGGRGIESNIRKIKPDLAIVFEGTPADDSFLSAVDSQGALKKGAQIRHYDKGMISNPRLTKIVKEIAKANGIKFQEAIRSGGNTNGRAIHTSLDGVPCVVIGVPTRYAHSHHCFAALEDYEASLELAKKIILALDSDVISSL